MTPLTHYRVVLDEDGQQSLSPAIESRSAVDLGVRVLQADVRPTMRPLGVWRVTPKIRGEAMDGR